jgi:lipopolysaccharide/colanic/teichoic acid biosynthesis glycosyltransferase
MIDRQRVHISFREKVTYRRAQRSFDLLIAIVALTLSAPLIIGAALAIKLEDRGPVFFRQRRVGRYGRYFTLYKFRTMRLDMCGDGMKPEDGQDPRITRIGRFLRKTSIDELPQFINVLSGDMAVVGPRPEQPFLVERYERWQHLRHLTKPGITGLWQITCRSTVPLHEARATHVDLEYIRTASIATDGHIVLRTFGALLSPHGAM